MSTPVSHPLVGAYLRDLEMLLHGVEPGERAEVLAGVHEHLEASLPPSASDDDVRRTLTELGSPQSVADEAYAGRPAPAPPAAPAAPVRPRPSPWLAQVACVLNGVMLALVLLLGWLVPHGMEWIGLAAFFTVPWLAVAVLTSMTEVWSSGERTRSILLIPATLLGLALLTWVLTALIGWHDLALRLTTVAVVLSASWVVVGLIRSAKRRPG
ncbi:HAAS signaling domain-containing protein [Knoellia aerolata]|uniref:DUF1700 domain-containing protein n=1 Tax=Knoellia aerolata DSM 18566 TaxID=1385519 RepID=A0A0A0K0B8_9MICO|nr:hypothetical protein [Knoellia aerolata]KGN42429.1 hypothetical protein N801_17355 [Knoellia aerolata DSM 18566]